MNTTGRAKPAHARFGMTIQAIRWLRRSGIQDFVTEGDITPVGDGEKEETEEIGNHKTERFPAP